MTLFAFLLGWAFAALCLALGYWLGRRVLHQGQDDLASLKADHDRREHLAHVVIQRRTEEP